MTPATKVDIKGIIKNLQAAVLLLTESEFRLTTLSLEMDEARKHGPLALSNAENEYKKLSDQCSLARGSIVEAMQKPEVVAALQDKKNKTLREACKILAQG